MKKNDRTNHKKKKRKKIIDFQHWNSMTLNRSEALDRKIRYFKLCVIEHEFDLKFELSSWKKKGQAQVAFNQLNSSISFTFLSLTSLTLLYTVTLRFCYGSWLKSYIMFVLHWLCEKYAHLVFLYSPVRPPQISQYTTDDWSILQIYWVRSLIIILFIEFLTIWHEPFVHIYQCVYMTQCYSLQNGILNQMRPKCIECV